MTVCKLPSGGEKNPRKNSLGGFIAVRILAARAQGQSLFLAGTLGVSTNTHLHNIHTHAGMIHERRWRRRRLSRTAFQALGEYTFPTEEC